MLLSCGRLSAQARSIMCVGARLILSGVVLASVGARAALSQRACGLERWRVKVALDSNVTDVDTAPVAASVAQLGHLPRPTAQLSYAARAGPNELRVFHVAAVLGERRHESDGDIHLVLRDPENPSASLIAEIPDSACALGSKWAHAFAVARRQTGKIAPGDRVDVMGIGFFDFHHGQYGAAPNQFELHPVLAIRHMSDSLPAKALGRGGGADTAKRVLKVWVNTKTHVYHCPGTRWYGRTQRGAYMTEPEARAAGTRPAYGTKCGG